LTSSSISNYHIFNLLIALLIFVNNHQTFANSLGSHSNYQDFSPIYNDLSYEDIGDSEPSILINPGSFYVPDNEVITSRNPWSQLFHHYSDRSIFPSKYYSPSQSGFALRNGVIPYPTEKRAIPIGFQKALFAHGIVGRRR